MKIFYSDHYIYPLPNGHAFPAEKYSRLRFALLDEGILMQEELFQSESAASHQILRAHSQEYYESICYGSVDKKILRQLGLPWSKDLVIRTHHSIGGVIQAANEALCSGFSGALAGGTHHAFRDEGRGFCVFNDTAVAALSLLAEKKINRCAVIDLDAHQGNGTAQILGVLEQVYILDLHGEKNYPVRKIATNNDIALRTDIKDDEYLDHLARALPSVRASKPDIIFYIAGVDPLENDRFGKMALTLEGLRMRDEMVFQMSKLAGIPLITTMGGGYANPIALTVQAHVNTYKAAKKVYLW